IFNEQKVQFLLMKAELYESAARILYSRFKNNLVAPVVLPSTGTTSSASSSVSSIISPNDKLYYEDDFFVVYVNGEKYGITDTSDLHYYDSSDGWVFMESGGPEYDKKTDAEKQWLLKLKNELIVAKNQQAVSLESSSSTTTSTTITWEQELESFWRSVPLKTERKLYVRNSWLSGLNSYKFKDGWKILERGTWNSAPEPLKNMGYFAGVLEIVKDISRVGGFVQVESNNKISPDFFNRDNKKIAEALLNQLKDVNSVTTPQNPLNSGIT
ncbi:MAG: hypothetical protein KKE50_05590, partial [Nanoarchaeota archaeon]|nr:hypothetical protein [Nanoarchaeota archaeon]